MSGSRAWWCVGVGAVALLGAGQATAQTPVPDQHPAVQRALALVRQWEPATIETQIGICQIPAPPFKETARAEAYRARLAALGLRNVRIDAVGNVIAERPGQDDLPAIVISGHLDTVFPEGTDVTVRREGTILKGPGIEDNCRGLAVLLTVARALDSAQVATRAPIWFVATVGEEGPGNLRGVRHLFEQELRDRRVGAFISVDADALNAVKDAVGSYRTTVTFTGPGGHSFGAFGQPNPMHALGRAIAKIADLQVPRVPRTTYSVGILSGGTTVNSIPSNAVFQIDMRSENLAELNRLDARFREVVQQALDEEHARWPESQIRLAVTFDRWGDRPAGTQPESLPLIQATAATAKVLGFTPYFSASSTDANLPMSRGIPSVTIGGGGRGRGGHSLDEQWDHTGSEIGTQWSLLLVATLAGVVGGR